jgi:hypothetical protein
MDLPAARRGWSPLRDGGLGGWVSGVIVSFGYWGVVTLMVAENLLPPIPSEVILPLAGLLVWQGDPGFGLELRSRRLAVRGDGLGDMVVAQSRSLGLRVTEHLLTQSAGIWVPESRGLPRQWHLVLPESVNRAPSTGTNRQS